MIGSLTQQYLKVQVISTKFIVDLALLRGLLKRYCHVWITQSWRLHFFPVEGERRIIVGYIGEHLPTKKYT